MEPRYLASWHGSADDGEIAEEEYMGAAVLRRGAQSDFPIGVNEVVRLQDPVKGEAKAGGHAARLLGVSRELTHEVRSLAGFAALQLCFDEACDLFAGEKGLFGF